MLRDVGRLRGASQGLPMTANMSGEPLPSDIDTECIPLCEAMNKVSGIKTVSSCCGHGKRSFTVFFVPDTLEALPPLLYWFDKCHTGVDGWFVRIYTDCSMDHTTWVVVGPEGDFAGADKIAVAIQRYVSGVSL